jgi:hypothetical protein
MLWKEDCNEVDDGNDDDVHALQLEAVHSPWNVAIYLSTGRENIKPSHDVQRWLCGHNENSMIEIRARR